MIISVSSILIKIHDSIKPIGLTSAEVDRVAEENSLGGERSELHKSEGVHQQGGDRHPDRAELVSNNFGDEAGDKTSGLIES